MKIKFHFFSGKKVASRLIKIRLSSIFSHVAIEFDGHVFDSALGRGGVTRYVATREALQDVVHTSTLVVDHKTYSACLEFCRAKVGTGYDISSWWGFVRGTLRDDSKKLFCSEFGRLVFGRATDVEIKLFNLLTPGQLRLMIDTHTKTKTILKNNEQ